MLIRETLKPVSMEHKHMNSILICMSCVSNDNINMYVHLLELLFFTKPNAGRERSHLEPGQRTLSHQFTGEQLNWDPVLVRVSMHFNVPQV